MIVRFRRLNQPVQVALVGGIVMLITMSVAGVTITGILARAAVDSIASRSALFLESLLSPLIQELATAERLGKPSVDKLDAVLIHTPIVDRFSHVDIWLSDGTIAYSTSSELIGEQFLTPAGVVSAFEGNISARYTDLSAHEHITRGWDTSFLEIYMPIRDMSADKVIAVVEMHELSEPLHATIIWQRILTWLVVGSIAALITLILFGIAWQSSRLEAEQKLALHRRLKVIERISQQNKLMRLKVQRASARRAEIEEAQLRKLGAEIHDGPSQLVGLSILKLEQIRRASGQTSHETIVQSLEKVLTDALQSMREIARGLMLPEVNALSLPQTINSAAQAHARRTETQVSIICDPYDGPIPPALRICAYRFVQEGLQNAFRHAKGDKQSVEFAAIGQTIFIRVRDAGMTDDGPDWREGLGLTGLRERVESLGGTFTITRSAKGTMIEMKLDLETDADL